MKILLVYNHQDNFLRDKILVQKKILGNKIKNEEKDTKGEYIK